jgi:hypothetical protein
VAFLEQRCLRIIRTGDGRLTPTRVSPRDVVPELLGVPRVVLPLLAGGVHDVRGKVTGLLGGLPVIGDLPVIGGRPTGTSGGGR